MKKDPIFAIVLSTILLLIVGLVVLKKVNARKYTYIARGIQCEEYDKDNNILKGCEDGIYGEVEIINPISVLKVKIE